MKKFTEYLKYFITGIVFGTANVIPGVSGGTMLVVFGIFDKLTESISGIKKIFQNIGFLLSFGLGAGTGIILSAKLIGKLFDSFPVQTNMFFIGLILGGVPLIYKFGTMEKKIRPMCIIPFMISFAVVIGFALLDKYGIINVAVQAPEGFDILFSFKIMLCAVLAAVTMIIPGISGSFIMMLIGVYQTVIDAINSFNFYILIPFAIGAVIGIIFGARLISFLIKKNRLMVYSALMGLVIGSVYAILPEGFGFNLQSGYGFVFLLCGIVFATLVDKIGSKAEEN